MNVYRSEYSGSCSLGERDASGEPSLYKNIFLSIFEKLFIQFQGPVRWDTEHAESKLATGRDQIITNKALGEETFEIRQTGMFRNNIAQYREEGPALSEKPVSSPGSSSESSPLIGQRPQTPEHG